MVIELTRLKYLVTKALVNILRIQIPIQSFKLSTLKAQNHITMISDCQTRGRKRPTCEVATLQYRAWCYIYNFDSWFFGGN